MMPEKNSQEETNQLDLNRTLKKFLLGYFKAFLEHRSLKIIRIKFQNSKLLDFVIKNRLFCDY